MSPGRVLVVLGTVVGARTTNPASLDDGAGEVRVYGEQPRERVLRLLIGGVRLGYVEARAPCGAGLAAVRENADLWEVRERLHEHRLR